MEIGTGEIEMTFKRLTASVVAVVTGVLGLTLVVAGPAAAATGSWKPYGNTNPISSSSWVWVCSPTKTVTTGIRAQVCAIREYMNGGVVSTNVRSAVIVRNDRSSLYATDAAGDLSVWRTGAFIDRWTCARSGVGANSWSVCFGAWIYNSANDKVVARGGVNGFDLGVSQQV